jgi:hypothetical protein
VDITGYIFLGRGIGHDDWHLNSFLEPDQKPAEAAPAVDPIGVGSGEQAKPASEALIAGTKQVDIPQQFIIGKIAPLTSYITRYQSASVYIDKRLTWEHYIAAYQLLLDRFRKGQR